MAASENKVKVELVGEIAGLEDERRYEVQRDPGGWLLIVLDEQGTSARDGEERNEVLRMLDRVSGALNTGGELRRSVDAMRDEWS